MNKYIINPALILLLLIFNLIFIISCGVNNPTSGGNQSTVSPNNQNISINAYKGEVHKQVLSTDAVNLLLSPSNPGQLTPKQIKILQDFGAYIEEGAYNEDYDNPYGLPNIAPIFRTNNHFMDPQHGNSALTDPPLNPLVGTPQNALDWMYSGDQYMFKTAKAEFDDYMRTHSNVPIIPGDPKLKDIMRKLGHILHMYQDMTSPPHVRNDNHSGMPYYNNTSQKWEWAGSSGFENLGLAYTPNIANIQNNIPNITNDKDLKDFFIKLGDETSKNYFSEDTIPVSYSLPPLRRRFDLPVLPDAANGTYDMTTNLMYLPTKSNPLVIAKELPTTLYGQIVYRYEYTLNDSQNTIPIYYSSQLMPKAITYSAAVIKYFLSEKLQPDLYAISYMTPDSIIGMDTAAGTVISTRNIGGGPMSIVKHKATNKLYTINVWGKSVSIIDAADMNAQPVNIALGMIPFGLDIDQNGDKVYVMAVSSDFSNQSMITINASMGSIMRNTPIPNTVSSQVYSFNLFPHTMAIDPALGTAYRMEADYNTWTYYIGVINLNGLNSYRQIPITGKHPVGIAIDASRSLAYVACAFDQSYSAGLISVIDLNSNTETATIPFPAFTYPNNIAFNPVNNMIYIPCAVYVGGTIHYTHNVTVVDTVSANIVTTIPIAENPWGISVDTSRNRVYVASWPFMTDSYGNFIDIIDTTSNTVIKASMPVQAWITDIVGN